MFGVRGSVFKNLKKGLDPSSQKLLYKARVPMTRWCFSLCCCIPFVNTCHGPCSVTFFLKNNQRTAPTESLMMATSPLFSATLTIGHPRWNYIGPPSDFIPYSNTTNKLHSYHCYYQPAPWLLYHSTTRAPPCSTHVPCLRPIISHMHQFSRSWVSVATRTCENLSQHPSAPFRV